MTTIIATDERTGLRLEWRVTKPLLTLAALLKLIAVCLVLVLSPAIVSAQDPVRPVPDKVSWVTAETNLTIAVIKAWRSEQRGCNLGRLALSEGIGNGITFGLKHWIHSPRPCAGCPADGMPSGHTMNSAIGSSSSGWYVGSSLTALTGLLRWQANRHTWKQVGAGAAIGIGAEFAGRLVRCE